MSRDFFRFSPRTAPGEPEEIPTYLDEMFLELSAVTNLLRDGHLDVSYEEPDKPYQGDIRYADGTSWDPGSGEGIYFYNAAGSWVKL